MEGELVGMILGGINENVQKLGDWRGLEVGQNRDLGERRESFWRQCLVIFENVVQENFRKGIRQQVLHLE